MSASVSTTIHTSRTFSPIFPTTSATACTSPWDAAPYTILSTTLSISCPTPVTRIAAAPALGGCPSTPDGSKTITTLSSLGSGMRTTSLGYWQYTLCLLMSYSRTPSSTLSSFTPRYTVHILSVLAFKPFVTTTP